MRISRLLSIVSLSGLLFLSLAADEGTQPGLLAQIYDMGDAVEDFPTIPADKKPNITRVDKQVDVNAGGENWPGTELSEHIYIRWTGFIKAPAAGKYTLFVESDDGSRIYIADKLVVDNNGLHGMEEKSAQVELKAGLNPIRIEFFENEGEAGCRLSWKSPDGEKQIIPADALCHKKSEK